MGARRGGAAAAASGRAGGGGGGGGERRAAASGGVGRGAARAPYCSFVKQERMRDGASYEPYTSPLPNEGIFHPPSGFSWSTCADAGRCWLRLEMS